MYQKFRYPMSSIFKIKVKNKSYFPPYTALLKLFDIITASSCCLRVLEIHENASSVHKKSDSKTKKHFGGFYQGSLQP